MSVSEPESAPRRALLVRLVPLVVVAAGAVVVVALAFTLGRRTAGDVVVATTAPVVVTTQGPTSSSFLLTADGASAELLADLASAIPVVMDGIYGIPGVVASAEPDAVRVVLPIASKGAILTDVVTQLSNLGVRAVRGTLAIEDEDLLASIPSAYVCTAESGTNPPPDVPLYSPLCVLGRPVFAVDLLPETLGRPALATATATAAQVGVGWRVSATLAPDDADAWYALDERCAATAQNAAEATEECPGGSIAILLGRFLLAQVDPITGATPGGTIPLDLLHAGLPLDETTANGYAAALRVAAAAPELTVTSV